MTPLCNREVTSHPAPLRATDMRNAFAGVTVPRGGVERVAGSDLASTPEFLDISIK